MDGTAFTLPPELERFADAAVAAGRYRDRAALLAAGVLLLQRAEDEVITFLASLEDARTEGERDGFLTAEQVEAQVRMAIAEVSVRRA